MMSKKRAITNRRKKLFPLPYLYLFIWTLYFMGCSTHRSIKSPSESMRPLKYKLHFKDDLHVSTLKEPLAHHIEHLKSLPIKTLRFGPKQIPKNDYILSLQALYKTLQTQEPESLQPTSHNSQTPHSENSFYKLIENHFQLYEVYGKQSWGRVFITSYYQPLLQVSRKKTKKFPHPIYGRPKNLVYLKWKEFKESFPQLFSNIPKRSGSSSKWPALLVEKKGLPPEVIPIYNRKNIDQVKKKAPVIAWADPIDLFFLQIQGSGTLQFRDGQKKIVGYSEQNGHPYVAIGKHLLDVIPLEKMSLGSIKKHLRAMPPEKLQELLNKNPSYVFFEEREKAAIGSFGAHVVPGRTIATDAFFFPKGGLALLEFPKPIFENPDSIEAHSWESNQRFVLDQDTGGAIKGPHRVDLFWGEGKVAEQSAGVMRHWGKLYYIVPKESFLNQIKSQ